MKISHRVTILGRELTVRSSASTESVQAVELSINKRLQEIGAALQSSDPQLLLMLALLNTTEELLKIKEFSFKSEQNDNLLNHILKQLDNV